VELTIRDASPADAADIAAFNRGIATETEGHDLDPALIGPGVERILSDRSLGRYWVAETEGVVVGQIMVTYEWSDWRNGMLWWVQSVYVHPDYRRRGIYTALYRHVESLAHSSDDVAGIRLYVEKDNRRAQQTYARLGMSMTNYRVMEVMRPAPDGEADED